MRKELDYTNVLFLTLSPLFAFTLSYYVFKLAHTPSTQLIIFFFLFYFLTGLSITAGYHRLFSHRAYKTNAIIKSIFLFFGAGAFQNSALKWCYDHRIHHTHVDNDKDPYNINKGFFYAHIGWIFYKEKERSIEDYPQDLKNDPIVMFQHKYYLPIAILSGLFVPTLIGFLLGSPLGGFAVIGLLRIVFVHHCTFFINSLCHIIGSRPYTTKNSARDSFIMAFFSYGEGYHNYHHYFPVDYRNGIKWYHFDPTKWLIKSMSLIGLAYDLKSVPHELIKNATRYTISSNQLGQKP